MFNLIDVNMSYCDLLKFIDFIKRLSEEEQEIMSRGLDYIFMFRETSGVE